MTRPLPRLPVELWIMILQNAPDLPSIYKIICISAHANAAFQIDSARILEKAIERSIPEYKHLARMIAIMGSYLGSSPHPTFEELVKYYRGLPEDVLTTAPPSSVFTRGPGPRYLVLTAYRIETLHHLCFVYLLQNIHEVIWSGPSDEPHSYPIKLSKDDVYFQAAAWWSPSWVEKTRTTRALWNAMMYWNIQAICPTIMDDYSFSQYRERIQASFMIIRPQETFYGYREMSYPKFLLYYEIDEMKCMLTATRDLLDYPYESFTPFTGHQSPHMFRVKGWASSSIFKETKDWKFEEPRPIMGNEAACNGQGDYYAKEPNSTYRRWHCQRWFQDYHGPTVPSPDGYNPNFIDYLGLCIWDHKRLGFLGVEPMYDASLGKCSGPLRKPAYFFNAPFSTDRWSSLFLRELSRLPGGQLRHLPQELKRLLR